VFQFSKFVAAAAAPVLLAGGAAGHASAAGSTPKPNHEQRVAVRVAVLEAEADVLGMKPEELRDALRSGKTVEQLAAAKGITKDQFADRLARNLKPRLDALVKAGKITEAEEDHVLKAIAKGHIPFWNGIHRHRTVARAA
jgi:cobalamin biosynthesis protein CbiD